MRINPDKFRYYFTDYLKTALLFIIFSLSIRPVDGLDDQRNQTFTLKLKSLNFTKAFHQKVRTSSCWATRLKQ